MYLRHYALQLQNRLHANEKWVPVMLKRRKYCWEIDTLRAIQKKLTQSAMGPKSFVARDTRRIQSGQQNFERIEPMSYGVEKSWLLANSGQASILRPIAIPFRFDVSTMVGYLHVLRVMRVRAQWLPVKEVTVTPTRVNKIELGKNKKENVVEDTDAGLLQFLLPPPEDNLPYATKVDVYSSIRNHVEGTVKMPGRWEDDRG
ncbi:hypothetical protein EDD85DRAFT_788090 [Armillaria nabsnona]|nr:hypothetical protein EDD85DRAFT_788090 [Armillaria nabsnona]